MNTFLSILGILGSFALIKYRQRVGDAIGEAEWMRKVGGVYNVIIIAAVFLFFWSLASLTGTTGILFRPIINLIPGFHPANPTAP